MSIRMEKKPCSEQSNPGAIEDDDMCQIRKTIRMLDLAAARLAHAMKDGDDSVDTLISSFTNMTGHFKAIQSGIEDLPETGQRDELVAHCQEAMTTVQSTTMAFQFYDRLSQRMQHISTSLDKLAELIDDPDRVAQNSEWEKLEHTIRSHYTLDGDLKMFDAVLDGETIENVMNNAAEYSNDGDIELF